MEQSGGAKVLVMAGTHQREKEFSHPTADLIIAHYGGDVSRPQAEFIGADRARRGELWDFGEVAVAKIIKIGEPSKEYLNSLSGKERERLKYVGDKAERHGGRSQWTSVHGPSIELAGPSFFFDLHSYNRDSEGMPGTGARIASHEEHGQHDCLMRRALADAQRKEPKTYGDGEGICPEADGSKSGPEEARVWGNRWYFMTKREMEMTMEMVTYGWDDPDTGIPDNYCFEAVHWGKENQEATARFITKYLASLL